MCFMNKPKMYFVSENRGPEWFMSYGVLSNGFCFGQHICSHPGFAPGDLYFNRLKRRTALKDIFGHEWTPDETELIVVNSLADKPEWWDSHEALQEGLKADYNKYAELMKEQ